MTFGNTMTGVNVPPIALEDDTPAAVLALDSEGNFFVQRSIKDEDLGWYHWVTAKSVRPLTQGELQTLMEVSRPKLAVPR